MTETITVLKIGGNELDDPPFLANLARTLATGERPLVLVHGGGKEISSALEHYGQPVTFIDGIRVTPPDSMAIMEMVVCGSINKRIVSHLINAGRTAIGLSGVDLGLLRCLPYRPGGVNLERVGTITRVDVPRLLGLLQAGWLPVIAPVALGQDDGLTYNVNADHVALGIAAALANEQPTPQPVPVELVFVSNVPGVLHDGRLIDDLRAADAEHAIQTGSIHGGMIPKVRSALIALDSGVTAARITNLHGLSAGGTRIRNTI